jgi:hypothetical protein
MALNQSRNLRRVLAGVAGIAGIAVIGSVIWFAVDWFQEREMKRRTNAYLTDIVTVLRLSDTPDFHQRIDKVRTFINDHSTHQPDEAFRAIQGKEGAFAAGVLAHARGLSTEPVHMECSTRSALMTRILHTLGYDTRIIAIFDSGTNLESHSFLEVMNPQTGQWESQDPDYDIYWRSKGAAGERISLADMAEAIGDIEPCGRHSCGWDLVSREGIPVKRLMDYLDIISVTGKQKTLRYSFYTSRADLGRTYTKGSKRGIFCEVESKRCMRGFYDITKYSTYAAGAPR